MTFTEEPAMPTGILPRVAATSQALASPGGRGRALLLLADGTRIEGEAVGHAGITTGELCFNTGMTGYQEIYTDPSYYGQIIINTTAHIGNYGVHLDEAEADRVMFAGLVCDRFSEIYSRHTAKGSLDAYLKQHGIPGIAGVDTRALVRYLRAHGAMNALICTLPNTLGPNGEPIKPTEDALWAQLAAAPPMDHLELSGQVTTRTPYSYGPEGAPMQISVLDLGVKRSILESMARRGVYCRVLPATATPAELLEAGPDGVLISNGPGDPAAMDYAVDTVRVLVESRRPMFGICLGHQILARAVGVDTYKMTNGHRGLNHPVLNLNTGRSEITSQNHGFAVGRPELEANADLILTHLNLNDDSVEGLAHRGGRAFSVQYHPEANPGPHDSAYLFDQFIELMARVRTGAA